MLPGEGTWWHQDSEGIVFHDGSSEPDTRVEGPELMDFATHTLSSVYEHIKVSWKKCIESDICLPIENVDVYDTEGKFLYQKHFGSELQTNAPSEVDFVPEEPKEKEDNGYDVTQESTRIFPSAREKTGNENDALFAMCNNDTVSEKVKPLVHVLGMSKLLSDYDGYLKLYENHHNKTHLSLSKRSKASISVKLKAFYRKGKQWIEKWQKDFYLLNAREPTGADIEDHDLASIVNYKLTIIAETLREWKVPFV